MGSTGKPSHVSAVSSQEQEPEMYHTVPAEPVSPVTSQDGRDSLTATMKSLCERLQRVEVLVGEKEGLRTRGASKPTRENEDGQSFVSCGKKGHVARFCSRGSILRTASGELPSLSGTSLPHG